jgi:glutamate-1-semialdehyde 2,1-aminomutase
MVLKFEGAYHGHGDHMVNMLPPGYQHSRIGHVGSAGIPRSTAGDYVVVPFNDLEAARAAVKKHAKELAAVIVEPVLGYISPRPGFLEGLREVTRAHDVCLIFDEVVTGCRVAYGGAQQRYGVTPDLTALGKAFGGGFPISAVCGRKEIMDCFDHTSRASDELAYHGGTLYGHPVCAAASLAVLTELEQPGIFERLYARGRSIRERLVEIVKTCKIPAQVIGDGPTWHICFTEKEVFDYRSSMAEDAELRKKFMHGLWSNGIHVMGRGYLCDMHTEEDLQRTVEVCERVLKTLV